MFEVTEKTVRLADKDIVLQTGRIARQANGAVLVTCGDTQVLVAVVSSKSPNVNLSYFPLSVDYIEKFYSAGRIPGGYIKRETRPSEREILTSRLIDRPIRPLFPETYMNGTQVVATVVSVDPAIPPATLAMLGASAALHISDIPFGGPAASARIGYKDKKFTINPSDDEAAQGELDLVVAGTADAILMVEAAAHFLPEALVLEAIELGHEQIRAQCKVQEELRKAVGRPKREVPAAIENAQMQKGLEKKYGKAVSAAFAIAKKHERQDAISKIKEEAKAEFVTLEDAQSAKDFGYLFEMLCYRTMRGSILDSNKRLDGRKSADIRDIDCQVKVLKRPHGSALFTRGETQSLGVVTLGTSEDVQRSESIINVLEEKQFMLNYNMPGYSVGECKRMMSPARREVGHGNLAERALRPTLPEPLRFPYTIRVVSEITESNGSSSMASVCSGTLAMLDAGVPLREPIAGIAMGLVLEGKNFAVLSDILGDEDHLGDMDFKVAGGKAGITALQMDIKIAGVSVPILRQALEQAREGRLHILGKMTSVLSKAGELSARAPRIEQIKIKPERVKDLIGPGGKNIKRIVSETGCKLEVNDSGIISLAPTNGQAAAQAKRMIQYVTSDPSIGDVFLGLVKKVSDFGCFVEIKPGVEGLVHISHLSPNRVEKVEEVVAEGEEIMVKVIEIDRTGRIKLSRKDAIGLSPAADIRAWI